jgi:hypothetical protein
VPGNIVLRAVVISVPDLEATTGIAKCNRANLGPNNSRQGEEGGLTNLNLNHLCPHAAVELLYVFIES